ncbi:uncharacterized protein F5Z01DRAFT_654992 [Emericellopsis atlantica]|uniref:Cell wall mannoprotein n=1 Tax=Emericellopsis atlantica TaxID=2614577 RepID=A0A9P8CPS5_9HYPO|nr:uncharacterized protein F5Z01DRAFT_654992 [Emericellopsis atlantica]KAG9254863.1 hypothetical protein F5Z01DRAFT_654992 [Emericellopsis atlantica]
MKWSSAAALSASVIGLAVASPMKQPLRKLHSREVPQEHSHDFVLTITKEFLDMDNPKGIADPVFGLLGNAAAAEGAGTVTNLDCLKQETADQAFTNAKAASDLRGMAGALLFQAIERNTGKVGLASVLCNEKAVNPEVAALASHQDPASPGAAETNKKITLELARQLAGIGADPNLALLSGTFAPGDLNDNTGAGLTCDTLEPDLGCIFSQKLLVLDATTDEIAAAVANVQPTFAGGKGGITAADIVDLSQFSVAGGGAASPGGGNATEPTETPATPIASAPAAIATSCAAVPPPVCSAITTTVAADAMSSLMASMTSATVGQVTESPVAPGSGSANLQPFTGALGGPPPPVESSVGDRPFSTNGATFTGLSAALGRSCDVQHNKCANAANAGQLAGGAAQCETQLSQCRAASASQNTKRQAALDFGSCSDPSIIFSDGLDGRKEPSFAPSNSNDFNHGSALGNKVITSFICGQLKDKCKAGQDAVAACESGAAAAAAASGQAAADAFNAALGVGGGTATSPDTGVVTEAPTQTAAPVASVVMTITQCV